MDCLPASAAGLLGRARILQSKGDSEGALESVHQGLAAQPGSAVASELQILEMQLLWERNQPDQALMQAQKWLQQPSSSRSDEVRRFAASLSLHATGCSAALPYLQAIQNPMTIDLVQQADCTENKLMKRQLLEKALQINNDPSVQDAILSRLGLH